MAERRYAIVIALLILAAILVGCGTVKPGNTPEFARRVLNCVYHGSMKSLSKEMTGDLESAMTNEVVREMGKALRQKFGKPRKITPGETVQEPGGGSTVTYLVETRTSMFRMGMTIDESNRISSLGFPDIEERAAPPAPVQ